jgi:hypothetical protein
MCDIPFDRSILQLSNGIRHVMPSTDRKLELTATTSMAQPVSQPAVCSNGLRIIKSRIPRKFLNMKLIENTQEKDPAQNVNNKESIGTD